VHVYDVFAKRHEKNVVDHQVSCSVRTRVTNLIASWGPYDTNMRHAQGWTSLITKKSETRLGSRVSHY
jgi:hypothetical protein